MTLIEGEEIERPEPGTLCNRKACRSPTNVIWWNVSTRAWYCPSCARLINEGAGLVICFSVGRS